MSPGRTRTMSPGTSSRGNDLPARIAPDACTDLQPFPQGLHDSGGPALLFKAQHGVDHQQGAHHGQVRIVSEHGRQNHDQFEHPRRDAPEFPKELENRVAFFYSHFVIAVLLPADVHLGVCKPGVGVDVECRERVGNGRGVDVRRFAACWLRERRLRFGFTWGCEHAEDPLYRMPGLREFLAMSRRSATRLGRS